MTEFSFQGEPFKLIYKNALEKNIKVCILTQNNDTDILRYMRAR